MTKRLVIFAFIFALMFSLVAPVFAQANVASVNTGTLNVRSGPGLQFSSIATLPFGFGVNLIARNDAANWVFISLTNGVNGWVNVNYIYTTTRIFDLPVADTLVANPLTPTGSVTRALNLNVRLRPDEVSQIVAVIPLGTSFELIGRSYDSMWANIRLADGTTGWVASRFVNTGVPVRAVTPSDGSVYAPPPPTGGTTGGSTGGTRTHLVVAGDTLAKIAQRYGVSMFAIAAANNITNLNLIYRGQTLIIP